MVASTYRREGGLAEIKRLCYAGLDEITLLHQVIGRLEELIPFEAHCAQTNDPLSGLLTHVVTGGPLGEREHQVYLQNVYFDEDLEMQRRLAGGRFTAARISDLTGSKLVRALRYREINLPLGLGHELVGICTAGREQWGMLCLIREAGRPDFDESDITFLEQITPHIAAGLKAGVLRSTASGAPSGENIPGVLVLDRGGKVIQHTDSAERWLREVDDLGPGWLDGKGLPVPVWMVVGALRRALKPETDRDRNTIPRVHVQARSGRWLTFHGAQAQSAAGRGGETVVIIEPSQPQELAWLRGSAYGLSERERTVVDRVTQGASTKEIAWELCISEYTVQEHLSNVFDKVGVRGRRALVKRLFFDHFYPTIEAELSAQPPERV